MADHETFEDALQALIDKWGLDCSSDELISSLELALQALKDERDGF